MSPPLIFMGPLGGSPGGGGPQPPTWPTDTSPYLQYSEQHFVNSLGDAGGNEGFTIQVPAGVDRTSINRSIAICCVSGALLDTFAQNPINDDFFDLNPGWREDSNLGGAWRRISGNGALRTNLFYRRFTGTTDDEFVVPASYQNDSFSVTYLIMGQNASSPFMRMAGQGSLNNKFDTAFDIAAHTYANDFNNMEFLYAHRRYTVQTPNPFLAVPTIDAIDTTGGWLEIWSAVDQRTYPNLGNTIQCTQWLQFWGRFMASTPDANSAVARTFTYTPTQGANQTAVYFRYELGL